MVEGFQSPLLLMLGFSALVLRICPRKQVEKAANR